jgi:hypothetical protein
MPKNPRVPKYPGVRKNHFVYCPKSANSDTIARFTQHKYEKTALNKDPETFWGALNKVPEGGNMVFLSHGDERGPLLVAGDDGDDFMSDKQIEVLGARLKEKEAKLYLLSCHTGKTDPEKQTFCDKLAATQAKFVAPMGFCKVNGNPGSLAVTSVEGETAMGWAGTDAPEGRAARAGRALELPRDNENSNKKKGQVSD